MVCTLKILSFDINRSGGYYILLVYNVDYLYTSYLEDIVL